MANRPLREESTEYRWISRTIKTVEKHLGRSAGWNGSVERDRSRSGPDRMTVGTMIVRDDTVLNPLRRATERRNPTPAEAASAAAAITTVAREAAAAIAGPTSSEEERALTRGTAELWAHIMGRDLVEDIGLVEAIPSLAGHRPSQWTLHVPATGAAIGLLGGLEERTHRPRLDIAHRILTAPGDRWKAIADVAIDLRVAGDERAAACTALAADGRARYAAAVGQLAAEPTVQRKIDQGMVLCKDVAEQLVRRMERITPSASEYLWAERVIRAVEARTGLPSRWNGRIYPTTEQGLGGAVCPDDTMLLSEQSVFEAVMKVYTHKGLLAEADLLDAVNAVHYVTHESAHASGPHPEVHDDGLDPVDLALEEGLAELWTLQNRSSIIQDIGMDQAVPAIGPYADRNWVSYAAYANATFGLVDELAELSGRSVDDVTQTLLGAAPEQRWGLIADLALDRQLPDLPEPRRSELRTELAAALRKDYEPVVALEAETDSPTRDLDEIQTDAQETGRRAIGRLADRIEAVKNQGDPAAEVSPEVRQLRAVAFVGNTPATPGAAGTPGGTAPPERGGATAARPVTGPVTARPSPAGGRGNFPTLG